MKLIKYRDAGMSTYTYFWVDSKERCASPFFNTEAAAMEWLNERVDPWDMWKPCKDIS